jgi:hypothetical protein
VVERFSLNHLPDSRHERLLRDLARKAAQAEA